MGWDHGSGTGPFGFAGAAGAPGGLGGGGVVPAGFGGGGVAGLGGTGFEGVPSPEAAAGGTLGFGEDASGGWPGAPGFSAFGLSFSSATFFRLSPGGWQETVRRGPRHKDWAFNHIACNPVNGHFHPQDCL